MCPDAQISRRTPWTSSDLESLPPSIWHWNLHSTFLNDLVYSGQEPLTFLAAAPPIPRACYQGVRFYLFFLLPVRALPLFRRHLSMVRLREIPRTASFAWSPGSKSSFIATGTRAGAVDADFSNETCLELWDLGLDRAGAEPTAAAKISTDSG